MRTKSKATPLPSPFAARVYEACRLIPAGRVASYGGLARAVGCRSARAVGRALRENPFAPEVPCHRVVASDGGLGGFFGGKDDARLAEKRALLEAEGVAFESARRLARPVAWHCFDACAAGA